jgi:MATE family multidrug resistance protein
LALSILFLGAGGTLIDVVSTSPDVRAEARHFLVFAALTPLASAAAFTFDGVFIGATWTRAMRDLMVGAFAVYLAVVWLAAPFGNAGLWTAMLVFLGTRGLGQAVAYPVLARRTFGG